MATRGLTFIEKRAPRAAGLSERAVDEHKELIGDLYLSQHHTRDQVIEHLKTHVGLSLSRDQFSKATRRWGFRKQRSGGSSIQPSLNEAANQCTTSEASKNEPLSATDLADAREQWSTVTNESSKRPRSDATSSSRGSDTTTHGPPSPFLRRTVKRLRPGNESDNTVASSLQDTQLDLSTDTDFVPTSSVVVEKAETPEYRDNDELPADYLACCYRYNKAFWYYRKISMPFQHENFPPKQRHDRILDMARSAKTRKASEIVREVMESELETSDDPLSEDRSNQSPSGQVEMCPMQSFLFHRHLAEIYKHRRDGASQMQKHLDIARGFIKAFDTLAPPSIDLWTLLRLLPKHKVANIPEDLLNSLQWDEAWLVLNVRDCLDHCRRALTDAESLPVPHHDVRQHENIKPTDMSQLATQRDPFHNWIKASFLFTFLWKKMQHGPPPGWKHHTISATQFLMLISRIIVRRSLLLHQHDILPLDPKGKLLELRASDRRAYLSTAQVLLHDHRYKRNQMKREFVTAFVEHYSWSPPSGRKSNFVKQIQAYQIEALSSVLIARRESHLTTPTSTTLKEAREMRRISADNEFLNWSIPQQGQLDSTRERDTIAYVRKSRYTPSFDSSSISSYLRAPSSAYYIHLDALNGNPTMSRSLASRSSRSSQVSVSSSFKRFKASAFKRRNSSESMMGSSLYDPERQLHDVSFEGVQDLQVQRYLKVTMGLSTLIEDDSPSLQEEEYTGHTVKLEDDERPSVRGRLGRLLKGQGKG
ncbi:uncharacterized protein FIESC28_05349 [Fusarium coffeatum]|uniref:Clr5 domain-containing protein n=1 Tax=Fusarium coffeatum TaxID=231269 RepID=A0A366RUJ9_9HYPO|nr:uncharacterized protein FIESC28_05349 [Fusarium coffeatum]RBR20070.1 hypothetical protein FIESC28_05349 [Fusarium coffeatum]